MNGVDFVTERYKRERDKERDLKLSRALAVARTREEMFARLNGLKGLNVKERETAATEVRKSVVNC